MYVPVYIYTLRLDSIVKKVLFHLMWLPELELRFSYLCSWCLYSLSHLMAQVLLTSC